MGRKISLLFSRIFLVFAGRRILEREGLRRYNPWFDRELHYRE